jgi:lipopolysaccharide heptosyltransferase III
LKSGTDIRRLLVIRPGAIGDTIASLPALEFVTSQATEWAELWVSPACVPLIRFGDRVRAIPDTGLDLLELGLETPARTALAEFDAIVSWYGSARAEFREAVRDYPFTFHPALPPQGCEMHATDWYSAQVGAPGQAVPVIDIASPQRDFIACQPFSGSPRKNWDLAKFRELATHLSIPVEFCAGPDEHLPEAHRFQSLDKLAEWLSRARGYVGNDSGITHFAAALGIPVVAIFRCTDPRVWAPRGRGPVRIIEAPDPGLDEVLQATRAALL